MKKTLVTAIIVGVLSQSLLAKDRYDRTFDSIYVAQKIYYSLDKRLNKVFGQLKSELTKRGQKILNKSEKQWVSKRDHRCAFPQTNSVSIQCAVKTTRLRLHFLENRLRECQEIGCKLNRL